MILKPEDLSIKDNYKLIIGSILPRPIALLSTLSDDGVPNLECKLYQVVYIGDGTAGSGAFVIGEIVAYHIDDALYNDGRIDTALLKPVGRLAGQDYTTLGRCFSMDRK
jgi:flavin reductase (DIM6/NTAB) family NADH-FMN oxidoreductase RutF